MQHCVRRQVVPNVLKNRSPVSFEDKTGGKRKEKKSCSSQAAGPLNVKAIHSF
jgi:hypothetical protein